MYTHAYVGRENVRQRPRRTCMCSVSMRRIEGLYYIRYCPRHVSLRFRPGHKRLTISPRVTPYTRCSLSITVLSGGDTFRKRHDRRTTTCVLRASALAKRCSRSSRSGINAKRLPQHLRLRRSTYLSPG